MSETVTGAVEKTGPAIGDVPRNCICAWIWIPALARHVRWAADPDCPWHISRQVLPWSPEVTR